MRRKVTMFVLFIVAFGLGYVTAQEKRRHVPLLVIDPDAVNVLLAGGKPVAENINHAPSPGEHQAQTEPMEEEEFGTNFQWIMNKYHDDFRGENREETDKWKSCVDGKFVSVTIEGHTDVKKDRIFIAPIK